MNVISSAVCHFMINLNNELFGVAGKKSRKSSILLIKY